MMNLWFWRKHSGFESLNPEDVHVVDYEGAEKRALERIAEALEKIANNGINTREAK